MLTTQEQYAIDEEARHYPRRQAMVVDALKIVQAHRGGWVDDAGVRDVAGYLGMTVAEVENIATFYNLIFRRPVGRHVILICDSVSCVLCGYDGILQCLRSQLGIDLGETTGDGRFTLLPIACLGVCDKAPALLVDSTLYSDLTPERIEAILADYL